MKLEKSLWFSAMHRYFGKTMSIQQSHGKWGEEKAEAFLKGEGFEIIARNWRYKRAEIDIVAKENGILVFIEVKTRGYILFGSPEGTVDKVKRRLIIDAAMGFMRSIGYEWEIRFDIVSIVGQPEGACEIKLFRDAFFPGLDYC
jgi:putative endonuclease